MDGTTVTVSNALRVLSLRPNVLLILQKYVLMLTSLILPVLDSINPAEFFSFLRNKFFPKLSWNKSYLFGKWYLVYYLQGIGGKNVYNIHLWNYCKNIDIPDIKFTSKNMHQHLNCNITTIDSKYISHVIFFADL